MLGAFIRATSLVALAFSARASTYAASWFEIPLIRREPDEKLPALSIVVPARDEERSIEACVRSLAEQQFLCLAGDFPKALDHTRLIDRTNLIEQHEALGPLVPLNVSGTRKPAPSAPRRHGRDENRAQMRVHPLRRDDDARPRIRYLAADRRIERRKPDLAAHHQTRPESPSFPNSGQTSASSPAAAMRLLSCAHPARLVAADFRNTIAPRSTDISTSFVSPTWPSNGSG